MIVSNSRTKNLDLFSKNTNLLSKLYRFASVNFNAMEEYSKPAVFSCLKCTFAFQFRNSRGVFAQLYIVLERQNATLFFCLPHKTEIYIHVFGLLLVISSNLCIFYFMCMQSHTCKRQNCRSFVSIGVLLLCNFMKLQACGMINLRFTPNQKLLQNSLAFVWRLNCPSLLARANTSKVHVSIGVDISVEIL